MLKRLLRRQAQVQESIENLIDGRYKRWDNHEDDDDLFLHIELDQKEIFREFIDKINKKKNFESSHRNIGSLMYYMGMHNLRSVYVLNTIEDEMDLYKEKFSARTAFGFFCGSLNLSAQKHFIHFAKKEYMNKLKEIEPQYALQEIREVSDAIQFNKNLDKEEKTQIWLELMKDFIQNNLDLIKQDFKTCFHIIKLMHFINLYEDDLFVDLCNFTLENKDCKEFENIIELHQFFKKFQNQTKNFENLQKNHQEILKKIEELINQEEDYKWRYNTEKSQLRSYKELYQQRENDRYRNQLSRFIPEDQIDLKEMREFKKEILDNPKIMSYDYDNLKQYIEAPWGDGSNDQFYEDEEGTIKNDLDSEVKVNEEGNLIHLEQLTFQ